MVTIWSKRARTELEKAYLYIKVDSVQNAEVFRDEIIAAVIALSDHPLKYPVDKFKADNDGSWRAFEKYHYRVSYQVTATEIYVVRMRHTGRSPVSY